MDRKQKRQWIGSMTMGLLISSSVAGATLGHSTHQKIITRQIGPYVGMILGASETHYNKSGFDNPSTGQNVTNGTIDSSGFGIRPLVGYQFNRYIAAEGSYTRFANTSGNNLAYSGGGATNASGTIYEYSFDLVGKFMYPIAQEVNVFARLGGSYLHSKTQSDSGFSKSRSKIRPTYGLGFDFVITQHFLLDASYNRIQKSGHLENADLFGLGFTYHF